MAQTVLDWVFAAGGVANLDGSVPAVVSGVTAVAGPPDGALGVRPTALQFGPGASCRATVSPGAVDLQRFAVRVLFRATAPVTTRANLVESTALPCSLFLEPGAAPDRFNVVASVANGAAGWAGAHTSNRVPLQLNQWYVASAVYDLDTMALLIDDQVVAVSAFPRGGLQAASGDQLVVGTWVDGARWPFSGEIAGVQLWRDIPEALEAKLDAERGSPEWHLTWKENDVRPRLNLGPKTADYYFDAATHAYIQPYALAVISYVEAHGVAFEMHGLILTLWRSDETLRRALGALASDEITGRRAGSRKNVFQNGAIYWSPQSGAVPVLGRMYLDYELIGEGASAIGLPVAPQESIPGGTVQRFQTGKMYLRAGATNAFEVHGAILAKYEATGGPAKWGFPNTHESDVRRASAAIGKLSEFERCTILWSPQTPASIIYGAIRDNYRVQGGPGGDLGFPTSDEADIPGAGGFARYNTFQRGSILWMNDRAFVCRPFRFALGRLDTKEEDRDFLDFDGQNDLYGRVCIDVNGGRVFDRKIPEGSGHYPSANVRDINYNVPYEVVPNDPNLRVRLRVEVWESDDNNLFGGGDDNLGTLTKDLTITNAWGLAENESGLFRTSNFGPWVNHLDWSIKPAVGANTPLDNWGAPNRGTPTVDWREYAAAFSDVDPDFELDFGIVDDGLKALYYEAVVKGVASGGNCFGMSLEAIYAWKDLVRLGRPLARFTNWADVENDFNVRHAYQTGADAIWWMVGQFLSGNTHDPNGVFQASWDAFNRGLNPVICLSQNYDFTGAPHCILPAEWNRNTTPWRIECFDPNRGNNRTTILVDSARNTFRYDNGRVYEGGAWDGGRLHYMPWSVLNHRQRTPVWDAVLLLLGGVVLIFADGTDVVSLTDEKGTSLDAAGAKSRDALKGKLLGVPGITGDGPVKGTFYVGRQIRGPWAFDPRIVRQQMTLQASAVAAALGATGAGTTGPGTTGAGRVGVGMIGVGTAGPVAAGTLRPGLSTPPAVRPPVASDAPAAAISGPALQRVVREQGIAALRPPQPTDIETIRASLRGRANGRLDGYLKRPLQGLRVQGGVSTGENVALAFERIGARDNEIRVQSDRARTYSASVVNKLGAGTDFVRATVEGLPAGPAGPARVNVQPGVRALDIVAPGTTAARVVIDGSMAGRPIRATFDVRLEGGTRFVLPDLADPAQAKVGAIDDLLGTARGVQTIKRQ